MPEIFGSPSRLYMCRRQAGKGEDDIDAILSQIALDDKKARKVDVVSNCKPPEPRVCGLWLSVGDVVCSNLEL